MRILLAVNGSKCSLQAVRNLATHTRWYRRKPAVELVNVQPLLPYEGRARHILGDELVERYYREEGAAALAKARKILDAAGFQVPVSRPPRPSGRDNYPGD